MKLSNRIKRMVKSHSIGSMYRLNAKTADCYAFSLYYNNSNRLDFEGGWDWSNDIIDKDAKYLYLFNEDKFIKRF